MKISLITICFNSANTIEETICSVLSQNYPNLEYIIIDGNSTDGTLDIVNRYRDRISKIISEPDNGLYDALNKGIRNATGDIIGLLHSDDVYANNEVLKRVSGVFENIPDLDACYSDLIYVDRDNPEKIVRYWKSMEYQPGLFERGWMPPHPTFFVKKSVYDRYGLFDTQYRLQSDFELTMRFILIYRIKTKYIPEVTVKMKMGGMSNNSIRNVIRGNLESYQICKKHGLNVGLLFIPRKILSRIPQYFHTYTPT